MGMAAILVMWHKPFILTFIPPFYGGANMKFGLKQPSGF